MPKRKKSRAKNGTVSVSDRSGMLRLRWSHQGKPYQLALGMPDTLLNRHLAEAKASEIQADIYNGRFDPTLGRYRNLTTEATTTTATADLFDQFTTYKRREGVSGQAIAAKYKPLRSNIQRLGRNVQAVEDARDLVELLRQRQSPRVANQNLTLLKEFGEWLVKESHRSENMFSLIKPMKGSNQKKQNRKPFSLEESRALLETVRTDDIYYRYHDFCYVLLSLGLRPSEAIGLRWQHIDLDRKEITIRESLSRSPEGKSSGYARQRKATKTETVRILPLSDRLVILFAGRRPLNAQPDALIFTTATGMPINDRTFRQRCWKRICKKAGVEYRPPYTCRHTFLSHGIEYEGWSPMQAAYMAGHSNARMITDTYGHMLQRPRLPEF